MEPHKKNDGLAGRPSQSFKQAHLMFYYSEIFPQ
jgi:hypothetical protein